MRLFDAFQSMIVALSIMVAAIFVRLNRAMPTFEWKSVEFESRSKLTSEILALSREYCVILGVDAIALVGLLTLTVVGKDDVRSFWPNWFQAATAGTIGGIAALSIARMAYVIWRDYDIVRLQKDLIDKVAAQESTEFETKSATEKIAAMRSAGLRPVPKSAPKVWGD